MADDENEALTNAEDAEASQDETDLDVEASDPQDAEDLSTRSAAAAPLGEAADVEADPDPAGTDSQEPSFDEMAAAMAEAIEREAGTTPLSDTAAPMDVPELEGREAARGRAAGLDIDLLRDVELNVKIELGRSRMTVDEVLQLGEGSVVELDKLAGDPVDVFVNDRLIARGEVLVLNDNFCVRINEIVEETAEAVP